MTRLLATLVILSLASTLVLTTGHAQDPTEVRATQENRFEPDNITITAGTTVTWVNEGPYHTVTSTDSNEVGEQAPNGMFDAELMAEGDTFNFTFEEPGTYDYYCKPHGTIGMVGTIIVTGDSNGGSNTGNGDGDDANGDDMGGDDTEGSSAPGFALLLVAFAALVLVYRRR